MKTLDEQFLAGKLNFSNGPPPLAEKSTPNMQASEQLERSKSNCPGKLLNEYVHVLCSALKLYHFFLAKRRKKAGGKENDPLPKKSKVQPSKKPPPKKKPQPKKPQTKKNKG